MLYDGSISRMRSSCAIQQAWWWYEKKFALTEKKSRAWRRESRSCQWRWHWWAGKADDDIIDIRKREFSCVNIRCSSRSESRNYVFFVHLLNFWPPPAAAVKQHIIWWININLCVCAIVDVRKIIHHVSRYACDGTWMRNYDDGWAVIWVSFDNDGKASNRV